MHISGTAEGDLAAQETNHGSRNSSRVASPDALQDQSVMQATQKSQPSTPISGQFVDRSTRNKTKTADSMVSRAAGSLRRASLHLLDVDAPTSLMATAGNAAATAPSLAEIRRGSFGEDGWSPTQRQNLDRRSSEHSTNRIPSNGRRSSLARPGSSEMEMVPKEDNDTPIVARERLATISGNSATTKSADIARIPLQSEIDPNLKLPWTTTWAIGLKASAKWVCTLKGFLITLYFLNVVAWGGMLFLLLCNAAPAMCSDTVDACNDFNSPRRRWMEIDQQILNVFFCLTGFGLAPWRFRDTWYLLQFRGIVTRDFKKRETALRKLAGIHGSWFRLNGCEDWKVDEPLRPEEEYNNDPSVPLPIKRHLNPPITGVRAPPTSPWKMDFLVWNNFWNTIFQAFLAAFMWAYNRRDRPPWTTALFISLAFGVAIAAGVFTFMEMKRVKKIEGVAPNPAKMAALAQLQQKDVELGIREEKLPVGFAAALRKSMEKEGIQNIDQINGRV